MVAKVFFIFVTFVAELAAELEFWLFFLGIFPLFDNRILFQRVLATVGHVPRIGLPGRELALAGFALWFVCHQVDLVGVLGLEPSEAEPTVAVGEHLLVKFNFQSKYSPINFTLR